VACACRSQCGLTPPLNAGSLSGGMHDYVNHYHFHILDPEWGHLTIKMSGHPPFEAQVMLNGHEYVACQARKEKVEISKEGNCFIHTPDATGLSRVADTLSEQRTTGRLREVCERWIYTTCLLFALDLEE
jgi:hypothetical protein